MTIEEALDILKILEKVYPERETRFILHADGTGRIESILISEGSWVILPIRSVCLAKQFDLLSEAVPLLNSWEDAAA